MSNPNTDTDERVRLQKRKLEIAIRALRDILSPVVTEPSTMRELARRALRELGRKETSKR